MSFSSLTSLLAFTCTLALGPADPGSASLVSSFEPAPASGPRPGDDLTRVLTRLPALALRPIGGLGQFSAMSLPTASNAQVPLFLDGAPLTSSLSGALDLAFTPFDAFTRVEVYGAHAPASMGSDTTAGALDLVGQLHQGPARLWFVAGLGSFATRQLRAGFATRLRPRLSVLGQVGYTGTKGNFRYFDDGGSRSIFADDGIRRRASNGYEGGFAQLRLDHQRSDLSASTQLFGWWRQQDVPGPNGARDSQASLSSFSLRSVSRVRRSILGPSGYVEWIASFAGEGRRFRDPGRALGRAIEDTLGRADDERMLGFEAWLSPRLRAPLWRGAWLTLASELRGEVLGIDERSSNPDPAAIESGDAVRRRFRAGASAELEEWLFDGRWSVVPGVRLDLGVNDFGVATGEGEPNDRGRDSTVFGVSPRLATRVRLFEAIEALELRGSTGRTIRFPSFFELFGDRGAMVGNEGLRPEVTSRVDGGLALELHDLGGSELDLFAQALGFVNWTTDLIQWVRSDTVIRPTNLDAVRLRGLELGAGLRAFEGDLAFDFVYTLLDAVDRSDDPSLRGKPVPGRPRHTLLIRPAGGHRFAPGPKLALSLEPQIFYELEFVSASFLDLAGLDQLPARFLHAIGVSLRIADRVSVQIDVRGLSRLRWTQVSPASGWTGSYPVAASDLLGFPLPGTSVSALVRVDLSLPRKDRRSSTSSRSR